MLTLAPDQIEELKTLCSDVRTHWEAGFTYLFLPGLILPDGCTPQKVDALLCPMPKDGYPSRLYFSQSIATPFHRNWNANNIRILENNWYAFSWQYQDQPMRLAQMVGIHLSGLIEGGRL